MLILIQCYWIFLCGFTTKNPDVSVSVPGSSKMCHGSKEGEYLFRPSCKGVEGCKLVLDDGLR